MPQFSTVTTPEFFARVHVARAVRNVQNRVIDHRRALLANAKQTGLLVQRVDRRHHLWRARVAQRVERAKTHVSLKNKNPLLMKIAKLAFDEKCKTRF
jgi:hypothetical protein